MKCCSFNEEDELQKFGAPLPIIEKNLLLPSDSLSENSRAKKPESPRIKFISSPRPEITEKERQQKKKDR